MLKLEAIALFAGLTGCLALSAADAAIVDLGPAPGPGPVLNIGDVGVIPDAPRIVPAGQITDSWYFQLGNFAQVGGGVASIEFTVSPTIGYDIENLGLTLYDSSDVAIGGGSTMTSFTVNSLAFGAYHIAVTGNAIGASGGQYAGSVQAAAPVPVPAALGLLASGLGALGLFRRRRREEGVRLSPRLAA